MRLARQIAKRHVLADVIPDVKINVKMVVAGIVQQLLLVDAAELAKMDVKELVGKVVKQAGRF